MTEKITLTLDELAGIVGAAVAEALNEVSSDLEVVERLREPGLLESYLDPAVAQELRAEVGL